MTSFLFAATPCTAPGLFCTHVHQPLTQLPLGHAVLQPRSTIRCVIRTAPADMALALVRLMNEEQRAKQVVEALHRLHNQRLQALERGPGCRPALVGSQLRAEALCSSGWRA